MFYQNRPFAPVHQDDVKIGLRRFVNLNKSYVNTLAPQFINDHFTVLIVPDRGYKSILKPQARGPHGVVGGIASRQHR
jgi:hypothetical protein